MKELFSRAMRFFRDVRAELRKVIWPDRRQTMVLTSVVVSVTLVITGIVWVFDLLVSAGLAFLLN